MEEYFSINSDEHFGSMFSSLHTLQKQGALCDVILAAEDGEVMAHKVLLMAASSYFRERLSQTISGTASRIYLKGISVMELANLVKYIYTGRLFVSKDTVDITLEISEILGLDGVIKGYNDIIHMQTLRNKTKTTAMEDSCLVSGQNVNIGNGQDSLVLEQKLTNSGTKISACGEIHHNLKEIKVLQYNDDGTSTTYTVPQSGAAEVSSTTGDNNLELQQLCQQYVEIPAGTSPQHSHTIGSPYSGVPSLETVVIDEQAQHQDLLSVAIKKLSDGSSSNLDDECASGSIVDNPTAKKCSSKKEEKYVNGKIDTKIVTLSAGKINNDLGGQTSVYTVALDPSTIKQPLKMPRVMRRKTDKEKLAEQNAKRYRQKKAELIAAKVHSDNRTDVEQEHDPVDIYSHQPNIVVQVKDINDHLVVEAAEEVLLFHDSLGQQQSSLRIEPFLDIASNEDTVSQSGNGLFAGQPQSMVPEVVISNHATVEQCGADEKSQEDFGCSVNFDSDDNGDEGNTKIVKISGKKHVLNESLAKQIENNMDLLEAKTDSVDVQTVTFQPVPTDKLINDVSTIKDPITDMSIEMNKEDTLPKALKLDCVGTDNLQCNSDVSPHRCPEKLDNDPEKSSASKRKVKVPQRLSLSGYDKTTGRNIPIVRTRRSSRNEGSPKKNSVLSSQDLVQTGKNSSEKEEQNIKQLKSLDCLKSIQVFHAQKDPVYNDKNDKDSSVEEIDFSDSDVDVLIDSDTETGTGVLNDLKCKKGSKRQSDDKVPRPRKVLKVEKRYIHDNCKRGFASKLDYTSHAKECVIDKEIPKESHISTRTSTRLLSKKCETPIAKSNKSNKTATGDKDFKNSKTKDAQGNLDDVREESSLTSREDLNKEVVEQVEIKQEPNTEDSQGLFHQCSNTMLKTKGTLKDVFPCKFCKYSTPLIGNLRKHMLTAHHLTVVNKKLNANKSRFKDFEEGTLLTLDGAVFDPKTMPLPKISNRSYNKDEVTKKVNRKIKKEKSNLLTLSNEDFTKEILKRHEEYLKQPEKVHKVMSKSLAVATAHPSFPQASPSIRINKANKLYHTPKASHSLVSNINDSSSQHYVQIETADSSIPSVEQEVEIQGHHVNREISNPGDNSDECVVTIQDSIDNKSNEIVVTVQDNGDGKLVPIQFLINDDGEKGNVDVVNVLLEEEQIQVHDEVEIQNE